MSVQNPSNSTVSYADERVLFPSSGLYKLNSASFWEISLSSRRLLVFVFMTLLFILAARPIGDPDFWWHLRTGQYLIDTNSIPHTDIFSVAHLGKEWITHEWLSEMFIYSIYHVLGYGGLIVLFSLIITAAFWMTYRRCAKRVRHPYVAGFALILGALASAPTWGVRPQMFSLLFASFFIAVLDDYAGRVNEHRIWWLVPLTILWVNMHAGFALGLALIVITAIGIVLDGFLWPRATLNSTLRSLRPLGLVLVLCIAAVSLNPNGARMYSYPLETLTSPAMMKYIEEWRSPDFHQPMFQALALLIFATFVSLALSKKRVQTHDLLILSATGYMALRAGRNIPFFVLVATPLLAEHSWSWLTRHHWGRWLTTPEKRDEGANVALKVALNIGLFVVLPVSVAVLRVEQTIAKQPVSERQEFPAAATEFIRMHKPPQPIYNEYGWGGYLIWKLYPEYRVYIDGRADVYGDEFIEDFLATHDGEKGWREALDRYGVRTVIVKPSAALASLLRQEEKWEKAFEDDQAVVFTRN
jgi:hypothetical protein